MSYNPNNPNGQATMANSSPVVIASNQTAVPASQSGTWTVQPGNTANTTAWKVDASSVAVPVTDNAGSLTVDNGGTFAVQATLQTAADTTMVGGVNIKEINAVTPLMGNGATGTGSQRVTVANDNTGIANWGHGATAAAIPAGATATGALGRTTLPTIVTSGQMVNVLADRYGRTYTVRPVVTNASSGGTAITTNTNTSIVAAPAAGNHLRIHKLWAQNSSATGTWCYWGNGSGVKTIPFYLAQYQPFSMTLDGGWELSTATALFMNTATTGANIEWFVEYETLAD